MGLGDTPPVVMLMIMSLIPFSWSEPQSIIPFATQTAIIAIAVMSLLSAYFKFRKKAFLWALPLGYLLVTLVSNILIMKVWDM